VEAIEDGLSLLQNDNMPDAQPCRLSGLWANRSVWRTLCARAISLRGSRLGSHWP